MTYSKEDLIEQYHNWFSGHFPPSDIWVKEGLKEFSKMKNFNMEDYKNVLTQYKK
jgi:hypothetical protein